MSYRLSWVIASAVCMTWLLMACKARVGSTSETAHIKPVNALLNANKTLDEALEDDDGFNQGASKIERSPYPFTLCPDKHEFSLVNAYWLAIASSYAYGQKDSIEDFARAIREQWGSDIEIRKVAFISTTDTDTQAMWLETSLFALLAFRGTKSLTNGITDGSFPRASFGTAQKNTTTRVSLGSVHHGFLKALNSIWDTQTYPTGQKIDPLLQGFANSSNNTPLFITGHSLGGALATLALARILTDDRYIMFKGDDGQTVTDETRIRKRLAGMYTYGSPRVGDKKFSDMLDARIAAYADGPYPTIRARFRNNNDIVTKVPYIGYYHLSPTYYFDQSGRLYSDSADPSDKQLYCSEKWWNGMARGIIGHDDDGTFKEALATGASDHRLEASYLMKLSKLYETVKRYYEAHSADLQSICDVPTMRLEEDQLKSDDEYCDAAALKPKP